MHIKLAMHRPPVKHSFRQFARGEDEVAQVIPHGDVAGVWNHYAFLGGAQGVSDVD